MNIKKILKDCLGFFAALSILALTSCSSTKNMHKEKVTIDSSYVQDLESQVRTLTVENDQLNTRISELEYTGIVFDNDCDSVLKAALLKAGCNVDSINAVMAAYKSKVKFYADGAYEVEGNLKSLTRTKSRLEETIRNLIRVNDSLATVKNKVEVKYEKQAETKEKIVKRGIGGLLWTLFILLIIAAFLVGFWMCWKYKDDIQEQLDSEERN